MFLEGLIATAVAEAFKLRELPGQHVVAWKLLINDTVCHENTLNHVGQRINVQWIAIAHKLH